MHPAFAPHAALSTQGTTKTLEIVRDARALAPGTQARTQAKSATVSVLVTARPEFISTSLTGAQSRPRGPRPGSFILTGPLRFSSFSFPLSSCQLGFYRYAYRPFISLSPGLCLDLSLRMFLHTRSSGFALFFPSPLLFVSLFCSFICLFD